MSPRNNIWSEVFFGRQSYKPQLNIPLIYPVQGGFDHNHQQQNMTERKISLRDKCGAPV